MNTVLKAKCELYDPSLVDAIYVAQELPDDEIEQIEKFTGQKFEPELTALWFWNTSFKIGCRDSDGFPLAVCGFTPMGPGVYRTFFLATTEAWEKHGRELTAHTMTGMRDIMARENIRRVETLCLASRKQAQQWYKILGLEYESTFRRFAANGEDAVMYTMIQEK